jgi:renal tumor antigen
MEFNFPYKQPTGVAQMLRHATKQCIDLINKLCIYDPDQRITAKDALRHPFFKDLREAERKSKMRLKVQQELPNTIVTNTPQYTHDEGPQRRLQYRQPRMKQKEDTHNFVSIKPKQYYMPKVAPSNFPKLMLPQVPKPPIQGRTHYHHGSGLSSGLPSLSHSIKGPGHISTFPSLFSGDNAPAKVTTTSLYPSL